MAQMANLDLILLFFFLGIVGGLFRIPLRLPEPSVQFLSFYLLLAIGFKGGLALASSGAANGLMTALIVGLGSCLVIPILYYYLAHGPFGPINAAALAASYGSVSAVTFIVACSLLEASEVPYSGFMVAVMATMEVPAIAIALLLAKGSLEDNSKRKSSFFRAAFGHKSIFLLLGGVCIGFFIDTKNQVAMKPLFIDMFRGFLAMYLVDLGAHAASEWRSVWNQKIKVCFFAWVLPIFCGLIALWIAFLFGMERGNSVLLATLAGSASYIAAPAAIRISLPEASPALYTSLPMALTFPFNVFVGIPVYLSTSAWLWK